MNFKANSEFRAADFTRLEEKLVPRIKAAVDAGAGAVKAEALSIVPVDTGALRDSIKHTVDWEAHKVNGYIEAGMPYAAYVEFGTGQRGAASPGAGPYAYSETWPGMPAQPYLRPSLDTARPEILGAFREQGFKV